ncbi:Trigger factor OS=Tsukamurella paurometabola (strain ATCC 8368 / DSM / CCUG 35730 / CIP 100753/ JCM 10117 / KCTC 9821 / NBRC 16120 / NCIMB 702349 / NCTC 13040) OX=521096 GN=tig PE=3 SV=1 [Tsukamurella paurometabola]|uniref:Trigger factor n=1 Tax=Tsukamurella paurometabola (strain ATCC 8368 / DSM 20162 / CCUG 35730 / CIP 100753 / JCM 10117 / KCTC 9821 / NBRC 16120 / NCIMB 702349 / NCTC 13040) TaxID=521096 RepID=D5UXJ5_TSUPD|nr:trigger factor [Tsukamurella paurometabola]ADG78087.1 trigger factor [Tsukamurella paurometabola DSM 20162]SUP30118.1 Trigger factor [Tsukamurella paurometabola]
MKSTVEQLSPTRVRLSVEVPFDELAPDFERAYEALAQQVNIPGFRKGKAPAKLIEARVGRDAVLSQVINDALPGKYSQAVLDSEVKALGQPEIDIEKLEYGEALSFTAEVDVRPEVTLPEYSGIEVEVPSLEVTDADVEEQLDGLRARFGTLKGVDRPVQEGDFVTIDLSATVDGKDVEDAKTTGLSHEVGSGNLIDGLDEAIVGLKSGESKQFTTNLVAGEFAGQEAEVTVTVDSVKERELPELDDEFAQLASEFDTVDELRDDLRGRVEQNKKLSQAAEIRDAVLEKLIEATEIPLPEAVVKEQADANVHDVLHQVGHNEELLETALKAQGTSREEFEKQAQESAEKQVKVQLLLDAIADAQDVQVDQQELQEHILFQSQRYGMQPQEFIAQIQQAGQLPALFQEVRRGKGLADVVLEVKVVDADGNPVDTKALFDREDADEAPEADSAEAESTEADEK